MIYTTVQIAKLKGRSTMTCDNAALYQDMLIHGQKRPIRITTSYWVLDGFSRVAALKLMGRDAVLCDMIDLNLEESFSPKQISRLLDTNILCSELVCLIVESHLAVLLSQINETNMWQTLIRLRGYERAGILKRGAANKIISHYWETI